jgi:hypothetical protein
VTLGGKKYGMLLVSTDSGAVVAMVSDTELIAVDGYKVSVGSEDDFLFQEQLYGPNDGWVSVIKDITTLNTSNA